MSYFTLPLKHCTVCREYLPRTVEYWHKNKARGDGLSETCKTCARARTTKWRHENPDRARETPANWRAAHPEYCRVYKRKYHEKHRPEANLSKLRHSSLERSFINTFTFVQWQSCMAWWDNKCAYCGRSEKLSRDHFFSVTSDLCIGTCAKNILPACRKCNSSKNHRDPYTWLVHKFGVWGTWERLDKIERYFASL